LRGCEEKGGQETGAIKSVGDGGGNAKGNSHGKKAGITGKNMERFPRRERKC